jgi:hypothetical protein
MGDLNEVARWKGLIAQSDARMRKLVEDYKAGNLPTAELLEFFVTYVRAQADYKSTVLTMMLAQGCSKQQIEDFIVSTVGREWPDFLPEA